MILLTLILFPFFVAYNFYYITKKLELMRYSNLITINYRIHLSYNLFIEFLKKNDNNIENMDKDILELYIENYLNAVDFLSYSIIKNYVNKDDAFNNFKEDIIRVLENDLLKKYIYEKDYKYIILLKEKYLSKEKKINIDNYSDSKEYLDNVYNKNKGE